MTTPPLTLEALQTLDDPQEILTSTEIYLARLAECETEAHRLRRIAYRALAEQHGPSEAARRARVSLTTIKNAMVRSD